MNIRAIAAEALIEVHVQKRSLNTVLPKALTQVRAADQALLQELLFGSCRWFFYLQNLIDEQLDRPLHKKAEASKVLLILGAYQLLFMRIPNHAAIHETVEAAKELKQTNTVGLINAVLRNISRADLPEINREATERSFPDWFSAKLKNNWPDHWQGILAASNNHPPMFLRVNVSKTSRSEYLDQLHQAGINATEALHSSKGIKLEAPCDVFSLPDFENGFVSVQDEAAQLSTELLELAPNLRVLDACSAPGGKTCAMLESEPSLELIALDQDASRLERVKENLNRLELNARTIAASAEDTDHWYDGVPFDRILLDAPCSATGVIRRHPDIKLLREPQDLKKLAELQLQLLASLWQTLKAGGKLVYATCSIFPQENARIIERFLAKEPSAELQPLSCNWGFDTGFGHQLFPQEDGHDGFFYAVLNKNN